MSELGLFTASHPPPVVRHSGHAGGQMSHDSESAVDAALIGERRHLLSLAFRMLGTVAEAEDAVQETYVRWYRMDQAERDQVRVPRAWLTRVASRICLDMLGTARARRERYVGPWLPNPCRPQRSRRPERTRSTRSPWTTR